eukprot:m.88471 g.88471  ORF g.88471 m.88471 type:complete len:424 (-) comp26201_c0_seq1:52-1323(-)
MASKIPADRDVAKLMEINRVKIEELKQLTKDIVPSPGADGVATDGTWFKYDDLFYLRYILSYTKPKDCVELIEKAVAYRTANKAIGLSAISGSGEGYDAMKELHKYQAVDFPTTVQVDGGMTLCVRGQLEGHASSSLGYERIPHDRITTAFMFSRERMFKHNDEMTRKTGYLAKSVILFDMDNVSFSRLTNKVETVIFTNVSNMAAFLYPQLQEKMCAVHAPSWMALAVAIFKKVLPKRVMDKVQMFHSEDALWSNEWTQRMLIRDETPDFLGGYNTNVSDVLQGKLLLPSNPDDLSSEITVSARSSESITHEVIVAAEVVMTICLVGYGVEVDAVFKHGGTTTPLFEQRKIKAEEGPVKIPLMCKDVGTLVITFDNNHSKMRSKTVKYFFETTPLPTETPTTDNDNDPIAPLVKKTKKITLL